MLPQGHRDSQPLPVEVAPKKHPWVAKQLIQAVPASSAAQHLTSPAPHAFQQRQASTAVRHHVQAVAIGCDQGHLRVEPGLHRHLEAGRVFDEENSHGLRWASDHQVSRRRRQSIHPQQPQRGQRQAAQHLGGAEDVLRAHAESELVLQRGRNAPDSNQSLDDMVHIEGLQAVEERMRHRQGVGELSVVLDCREGLAPGRLRSRNIDLGGDDGQVARIWNPHRVGLVRDQLARPQLSQCVVDRDQVGPERLRRARGYVRRKELAPLGT
mmetsp:Transcript_53287/g.125067  ORF Transcript_53287/g.125067 Transcript_53287/m.125067 type:complete len:268 (-) Transcript_53287:3250-4053(-)